MPITPDPPKSPLSLNIASNDIRSLTAKRGTVKGKLTLFVKYVATLNASITLNQKAELQLRLENAKLFYTQFDQIQSRIEELADESEIIKQLEERDAFENQYYQTMSVALSFVNGDTSSAVNSSSLNSCPVKLPTIALPAFDGSYEHWLEFRDTYTSLIHNSKDIGVIQKFHYLRAALTGNALQVIKSLEFCAENYTTAWELLENRYNNHRLLTHNYVKSLFNTQTLHKESSSQIRKLIDTVLRNLRALKTLGEPTDSWDTLVIYLIVTKLDSSTEREWEQYKGTINVRPEGDLCTKIKLTDLMTFLRNRADMLESISANHSRNTHTQLHEIKKSLNQSSTQQSHSIHSYVSSSAAAHTNKSNSKRTNSRTCSMCKGNHPLYSCSSFLNLAVQERIKLLDAKKLCHNCLRDGHTIDNCFFGPCRICQKKHNSLIHIQSNDSERNASKSTDSVNHTPPTCIEPVTSSIHHTLTSSNFNSHTDTLSLKPVLLSTALVDIRDINNKKHRARVILDNGSQHSYVTQSFISKLNAPLIQSTVKITGVGQSITQSTHSCNINLQSTTGDFHVRINCMVLPCITDQLPSAALNVTSIQIPEHIRLADPTYYKPSQIDLLLGADIFWDLLCDGRIRLAEGPCLQNSKLGWIISGPLYTKHTSTNKTKCHFTQTLDTRLMKFWELEEIPKSGDGLTSDERACEQLFKDTTLRDENGRFSVRMPLKESPHALGDSYDIAKNRFLSLERKLDRFPDYKKMYSDFITEYIQLGHMSPIHTYDKPYYFLPHHGVFREHSATTKLRVVFDGGSSSSSGKSLNDLQLIGPPLQNDVFSILLRFREDKYVACADVEKMYRQVLIQPDQRNLQLILWRENSSDPLSIYQLNTVTYGTASAPYLSIRCLQQLASECRNEEVSRAILKDCYVDDLVTGNNDKQALIDICEQVTDVLKSGCFPLRKWIFNFDVSPFSFSEITSRELALGENCQNKTLGLGWISNTDQFHYTTNIQHMTPITKRTILSVVSQIYDPLGLLSPAIIIAKVLLQRLWLCKLGWDDEVPSDVAAFWHQYIHTHKQNIRNLRIPRYVMGAHTRCIQLHLFTDSSQTAFGACAYIRTHSGDDSNNKQSITVKLLCAKSKVAPLKPVTIPRLELCGALLGAQLYFKIVDSLKIKFDTVTFWSDSTIVLGWLRMSPHLLKTFVQSRVVQINELTGGARWLHVGSKDNPADLVTRGLAFDALNNSDMWFGGPPFLREPESNWLPKGTSHTFSSTPDDLPEVKSHTITMTCQVSTDPFPFEKFSSFSRLKRSCAYVLRFINNTRNKNKLTRNTGPLTLDELNASVLHLARLSQIVSFPNEYYKLKNNLPIRHTRNIAKLNIFFDTQHKVLRVGGRISNSPDFSYDKKHPILLCSKHRFTLILFQGEHKQLLHAAPQLLLYTIKGSWWPLGGTNLAKQVVRKCITCTRMKGETLTPIMGNLPSQRLEPGFPFMRCGVDYAGPVLVLNRKGRGAKLEKNYICVIVCFSTRAVYLDLVTSLTTDGYLLALKRFISRRGKPAEIFSDNGKNFVGALKELSLFLQSNAHHIIDRASTDNIKLTFIPPYSPHFGGVWESGVRSCKHHLRRVIGNAHLTYEEFSTVLAQIEAVLNSRPMHPMSADPNDLVALTPAHFLIGRPMTAPPSKDLTAATTSRLPRYERLEQIRQHFWQRWSKDYISQLQTRTKWQTRSQDIVLHSLVLIKEDNLPPLKWRLGRVVALFTGNDGVSRVAEIQTAAGLIRRAFSKICPLPLQPEGDAEPEGGAEQPTTSI